MKTTDKVQGTPDPVSPGAGGAENGAGLESNGQLLARIRRARRLLDQSLSAFTEADPDLALERLDAAVVAATGAAAAIRRRDAAVST